MKEIIKIIKARWNYHWEMYHEEMKEREKKERYANKTGKIFRDNK